MSKNNARKGTEHRAQGKARNGENLRLNHGVTQCLHGETL